MAFIGFWGLSNGKRIPDLSVSCLVLSFLCFKDLGTISLWHQAESDLDHPVMVRELQGSIFLMIFPILVSL